MMVMKKAEENGISRFECSVDGSSFSTCTSPAEYDNLSNGSHVIEVGAQDNAGNKDPSPSSFRVERKDGSTGGKGCK